MSKRAHPLMIAIIIMVAFSLTASAATYDPFTQAYGQYVWGDYILAGNSNMRCIRATDQDTRDVNDNGNFTEALGSVIGWTFYADCETDTQQSSNPAVLDPLINDQRWMVYGNTDTTTAGIFNSSEVSFSIPPEADIAIARLYWGGNRAEAIDDGVLSSSRISLLEANGQQGTPGSPWYSCNASSATLDWAGYGSASALASATTVTRRQAAARRLDGQFDEMELRVNNSAYQTIAADEGPYFGVQNFGGAYFASQADVTSYVQQQLDAIEVSGQPTQLTFTGANVATGQGFNCHGGWALVVVYEYQNRDETYAPDYRYIEIFDGMAEAQTSSSGDGSPSNTDEVNLALTQFTAASGAVEPRFGLVAYEGDAGLVGDQLQFEFGEAQETTVTEPKNGRMDNYFSSTIGDYSNFSSGFDPGLTRNPNNPNNDGMDAKIDHLDPQLLYNAGSNLNVRMFSNGDRFVAQVFTFSAVVASISGTVYEDDNDNGQIDSTEAGIPNVTLTLTGTDSNGGQVSMTTTSDSNGGYTFINVPPSNATGYTISETHPAGYFDGQDTPGTIASSTVGTAQEPDTINGIVFNPVNGGGVEYNFGEIRPAQLSGSVYEDLNGNGLQDVGEPGIPSVTVTLSGTSSDTATTNSSGYYSFTNLVAGNYTVTETDPASLISTGSEQGTIGSTPQSNNVIDVTLAVGDDSQENDFLDSSVPSLQVDKQLNGTNPFIIGETISFTIRITNTGGITLTTLPLEDRYDESFMTFDSASPVHSTSAGGVVTWADLLIGDADGLGIGESISVIVLFTTAGDTTLAPAVPSCVQAGQAGNLAEVTNAMANIVPVVTDTDDDDCAGVTIFNTTGVKLASSVIEQIPAGVLVRWQAVDESNIAGYYVRTTHGANAERRSDLIPREVNSQSGSVVYEWLDTEASLHPDDVYVIEIINLDGSSENVVIDVASEDLLFVPLVVR